MVGVWIAVCGECVDSCVDSCVVCVCVEGVWRVCSGWTMNKRVIMFINTEPTPEGVP